MQGARLNTPWSPDPAWAGAVNWAPVEAAIAAATGQAFRVTRTCAVAGGCINEALRLEGEKAAYFVKLNEARFLAHFEAEGAALKEMAGTGSVRVPEPVCTGADEGRAWLVLEYVSLSAPGGATAEHLGEQLAAMHRYTAQTFGWKRDNNIGSTPQINPPTANWTEFFATHRLGFQLDLAESHGAPSRLVNVGRRLQQDLPRLLEGHRPPPSLLHGDLWGGNWAADPSGQPVLFDPASYYGDREADLAMTELFGRFDDRFYEAYRNAWAIEPGYEIRKVLYNLYHILNHFNLFGGGYAGQAQAMADRLLAELS